MEVAKQNPVMSHKQEDLLRFQLLFCHKVEDWQLGKINKYTAFNYKHHLNHSLKKVKNPLTNQSNVKQEDI